MGPPIFIGGKYGGLLATLTAWCEASMGPPIFIGGKFETRITTWCAAISSMGPPIFIGGKALLRCTHAFHARISSMGPPIFIGGKKTLRPLCTICRELLQWGHRFSSVESVARGKFSNSHRRLQWGHRFSSVERLEALSRYYASRAASMGPPIFIGGK